MSAGLIAFYVHLGGMLAIMLRGCASFAFRQSVRSPALGFVGLTLVGVFWPIVLLWMLASGSVLRAWLLRKDQLVAVGFKCHVCGRIEEGTIYRHEGFGLRAHAMPDDWYQYVGADETLFSCSPACARELVQLRVKAGDRSNMSAEEIRGTSCW